MGKLHKDIMLAIATYYANRGFRCDSTFVDNQLTAVFTGYKWNKEADLERVTKACLRHGCEYVASAGTFLVRRRDKRVFRVDDKCFPDAVPVKRQHETKEQRVKRLLGVPV